MLYLIAYDIRSTRRLRATAKICRRYGVRVGLSVFEAHFESKDDFENFSALLNREIDEKRDLVRIYRICENCLRERIVLGRSIGENPPRAEDDAFIF